MIRILLVDDHKIIRDGLKALLGGEETLRIVGECEDGDEVLQFLSKNEVDVILMDINMPVVNGIEATRLVTDHYPGMKIIALTMHDEDGYISKVLKAGASGYVLKNAGKTELVNAIKEVALKAENYYSKEVADIMMKKYLKKSTAVAKPLNQMVNPEDLTKRELEILKLIAEELTNNEIADKLYISPRTVDTHRRNLLQKLAVKNTAGLVKFAIQHGIIDA